MSENAAKSAEDLTVAEDKVAHLNQIKNKLESTLDELESSLEREKRGRTQVEKERRKVEGELKVTQETVCDLERARKELEATIERKEKDAGGLLSKLDDEQSLVAKVQKGIKENQARVEEMEEVTTISISIYLYHNMCIRSLRPRGRLVLRLRGRGPTWRVSSRTWESVLERPPEPPLPRLNSTRSARLRSISNNGNMMCPV